MLKNSFRKQLPSLLCALVLLLSLVNTSAVAQNSTDTVNILPAKSVLSDAMLPKEGEPTHPTIRIIPDKSEIIRLDSNAKTIIIGNPAHLSILADTPTTLILVAKLPGTTQFTVLDKDSAVIMQRRVIIAAPKENYVRLRKSCAGSDDKGCQSTSVYYCPDMCHEVKTMTDTSEKSSNNTNETTGQSGNSSDQMSDTPTQEPGSN